MDIFTKRKLFEKYIVSRYGKYYFEDKIPSHIKDLKKGFYAGIKAAETCKNREAMG